MRNSPFQRCFSSLLFGFLMLSGYSLPAWSETYTSEWGHVADPTGSVYFSTPVSMVRDAGGSIYVADTGNSRIVKLNSSGGVIATYGSLGSGLGQFSVLFGVAVDKQGNILVADTANYRIQKFDANMQFITSWGTQGSGPGQFGFPREIAVDSQNRYFVTDEYNHRVQVFDSNGTYLYQFGGMGSAGGQFRLPQGIAIDSNDNVFVGDTFNHRIQKLSTSGVFLAQIGSTGIAGDSGGLLYHPRGVGIDADDNVYVVDTFNHKIKKYTASLSYLYSAGGLPEPAYPNQVLPVGGGAFYVSDSGNSQLIRYQEQKRGVVVDGYVGTLRTADGQFSEPLGTVVANDRVYVADRFNHRIQAFDLSGGYLFKWGKNAGAGGYTNSGFFNGQFNVPSQLAADAQGRIYVADAGNARIQVFDGNGNFITRFGMFGAGNGQFNTPVGVAVDSSGNVFVSDYGNSRIQKFNANFQYVTQWGSEGTADGQFRQPFELTVDAGGNVYVADRVNGRVQKFDNNGNFIGKWGTNNGFPANDPLLNGGNGDGEFFLPNGIHAAGGYVYVSDSSNNRMQKFDLNGTFITKWGSFSGGAGNFFSPAGIGVDAAGNVYSADLLLNRIQKFAP